MIFDANLLNRFKWMMRRLGSFHGDICFVACRCTLHFGQYLQDSVWQKCVTPLNNGSTELYHSPQQWINRTVPFPSTVDQQKCVTPLNNGSAEVCHSPQQWINRSVPPTQQRINRKCATPLNSGSTEMCHPAPSTMDQQTSRIQPQGTTPTRIDFYQESQEP